MNRDVVFTHLCKYVTYNEKEEITGCRIPAPTNPTDYCPAIAIENGCPFVRPERPLCPFDNCWADLDIKDDEFIAAMEKMKESGFMPTEHRLETTGDGWRVIVGFK